ncbi:hypothetical protein [Catellatospora citrea]|uniref:hypothetical protein n=1 Tax=Catellatospora citrea TaxID=53366 RepID=UPI0011C41CAC|nr:hypothetical protein [Catellatospora citrea]
MAIVTLLCVGGSTMITGEIGESCKKARRADRYRVLGRCFVSRSVIQPQVPTRNSDHLAAAAREEDTKKGPR